MKKTIWLMVILFVMAGGIYTYIFFSSRQVSKASTTQSCCSEVPATSEVNCGMQESCTMTCPSAATATPSVTPTPSSVKTQTITEPCENCVCGTDQECPNEDKCQQCLEEEQQKNQQQGNGSGNRFGDGNGKGNGNGSGNQGQHRNGRK